MSNKVMLTAAITGAVTTPSMSPYIPQGSAQIIDEAVKAYEAGASMVHIHAREAETGKPTSDIDAMYEIVSGIKKRCNVVIGITTGGALGMTPEERLAVIPKLKPEIASCNAGSMNFVLSPAAEKIKPIHDWEIPFLKNTYDYIFANTFKTIEYCINIMNENGTLPEFEVFDVGMINNIAYFVKKGIVKQPIYLQFVTGVLGGIQCSVDNLSFLVKTAKEQIGEFMWSCVAPGRQQFSVEAAALAMGGNARVGLEDSLWLKRGQLAKSNAEQVTVMREIAERMGFEIATPDEARKMLNLKGLDKVAF
ncbi:3-keto-5-aminohexanoate cleavage enzyme [Sporomusa carbonis]|uniref:3-keto-5-aminohexanoate cleavage protein n=1 Tax=Sporomusa carbonis TaxID=3076075 RepID=UPI003A622121